MGCEFVAVRPGMIEYKACSGCQYLSLNYHQGLPNGKKSKWAIPRPDECSVFCEAREADWADEDSNLWSITQDAATCYGKENERMAYFDGSGSTVPSWHGYPVSGRSSAAGRRRPPQPLVQTWHDTGRINSATYERIISSRL
jgi:hypothetical protein